LLLAPRLDDGLVTKEEDAGRKIDAAIIDRYGLIWKNIPAISYV